MTDKPFRAIIVGGGITGLATALALEKAAIDFLVLEARDIAPHRGASISIHPHVQIVMEQLGVWPEIAAGVIPLTDRRHYDQHGSLFDESFVLKEISKKSNGRSTVFMERKFWLQSLYNQITNKQNIHTNTKFIGFTEHEDHVEVVTDTGEILTADLVIGADGVHSAVRGHMAAQLKASDPITSHTLSTDFESNYHCIFATSRNERPSGQQFLPDAMVHNVYYPGFSGVAAAGVSGLVFWFLFIKSDQASRTPNTPRFTEDDMDMAIKKYGHFGLGQDYRFKDLWDVRVKAAMVPLEEGVVKPKWSSGSRVVLVGDSVHKATINPGLGGNLAVEGVVHLVNPLVKAIVHAQMDKGRKPTRRELGVVLAQYEMDQRPRAEKIVTLSGYVTRLEAMETWWLRLLLWVIPWISDATKASTLVDYMKDADILEFLPHPDQADKT